MRLFLLIVLSGIHCLGADEDLNFDQLYKLTRLFDYTQYILQCVRFAQFVLNGTTALLLRAGTYTYITTHRVQDKWWYSK